MDFAVIPECYVDTKLIKAIVPPTDKNGYNHQKGCNTVVNLMKGKLNDHFALGIVDKDKRELDYIQEFEILNEQDSLELYKHRAKHHYLILICPAIERWILERAEESGVRLEDFGLPNNLDELRKITKTSTSEEKDPYSNALRALFRELVNRQNMHIEILGLWVSYLKNNHYHTDIEELIKQTEDIKRL
jgi:hypothetical protein